MEGWPVLLANATAEMAVLVLDTRQDGLTQIAEVAAELQPLQAIRIADPASAAGLRLGSLLLTPEMLDARRETLTALGDSLMQDGVLVLHQGAGEEADAALLADALSDALNRDVTLTEAPLPQAFPRPLHKPWPRPVAPATILHSPWLTPRSESPRRHLEVVRPAGL
jgi:hypothetical protein